jgi:putative transposase
MQIIKSITAKRFFKEFPEIKKELWGSEFWSDGGYIGTVGEGVTAEILEITLRSKACQRKRKVINK